MIAVEVTFLTDRYVASAHDQRDVHEWPPHWARMYSAMVAAWGEAGEEADEAALLRGIETWGHPAIAASNASMRQVPIHWVPVNDTSVHGLALQQRQAKKLDDGLRRLADAADGTPKQLAAAQKRVDAARDVTDHVGRVGKTAPMTALQLLPEHRTRQERRYPSVTPFDPRVLFVWPDRQPAAADLDRLDHLLARVVRLGHSSSMVSCRAVTELSPDLPEVRYVPDRHAGAAARETLRSIGPGQLDALVTGHRRHRGSGPRSMPHRAATYRDRAVQPDDAPTPDGSDLSGQMIMFERTRGTRLPVVRAVDVARALRGTLMAHAADPLPEVISGHRQGPGGTAPSSHPHVAYVPLPFVGGDHATGHLLGAAVILPREIASEDHSHVEAAIVAARLASSHDENPLGGPTRPLRITLGPTGAIDLTAVLDERPAIGLRTETWARPARSWVSATPIALPRHPGALTGTSGAKLRRAWERATEAVVAACRHVGLPEPADVHVQLAPLLAGSRDARAFPRFFQGSGSQRQVRALVHAEVSWAAAVEGPLLLGAGRYQGLGLMRPVVTS